MTRAIIKHTLKGVILSILLVCGIPFHAVFAQVSSGWTPDLQFSKSLTAIGTAIITTNGAATVSIVATGSGSSITFAFQGTSDNGTTWSTLPGIVPTTGAAITSFSTNGVWIVPVAGFQTVRVNLTAIGGGTETFTLSSTPQTNVMFPGPSSGVTPTPIPPSAGPTTNSSTTITTGGTFQTIANANTSRKSLDFVNICSVTGNCTTANNLCYLYFGSGTPTVANSIVVGPGQDYLRSSGIVPSDIIKATCDGTADNFYLGLQ